MSARDPQAVSRRAFLVSAPAVVATLARCTGVLWDHARLGEKFVIDPAWSSYRPILDAAITAILPFDHPAFPAIGSFTVRDRLILLFPLESESRYLGLQRALILLDEIDLFTHFSGPLLLEESRLRDLSERGGDAAGLAAAIRAEDVASLQAFRSSSETAARTREFTALPLAERRSYLAVWRGSASVVKRQFVGALRSLIMVSAWSLEETWPSIGYAGPLIARKERLV